MSQLTASPPTKHLGYSERVEVLEGTISCRVAGTEHVLRAGESLTIPPGIEHAVWSADPSGSRSIGEYRPALDMARIFERAFSEA